MYPLVTTNPDHLLLNLLPEASADTLRYEGQLRCWRPCTNSGTPTRR